jgi:hypothetical protein
VRSATIAISALPARVIPVGDGMMAATDGGGLGSRPSTAWSRYGIQLTERILEGVSGMFVLCGEASCFFAIATDGHDAPAAPSGGVEEQPSTAGPRAGADAAQSRRCEQLAG